MSLKNHYSMKTKKFFVLACLVLSCLGSVKGNSFSLSVTSEGLTPIVIVRHGTQSGAPRSIVEVQAEYDDVLSSVRLYLANAGTSVSVSIENLTTSEIYGDTVSGSGMALIPISGTSGVWLLTISLENGDVYEGEFEL